MINRLILLSFLLCLLQGSINFNYESKYGDGSNVDDFTQDTTSYYYFENLLDINYSYNNFYIYTQLEYSDPPIYGYNKTQVDSLLESYFIEYSNSSLVLKWGHLQSLYGYGLDINMFQDQSTDFDNRVKGLELKYSPNDIADFFFISGKGSYGTKSSGSLRENDLYFDHNLDAYGMQLYTNFGDFSISSSSKKTDYSSGIYNKIINSDSRLSIDLQDYIFNDFSIYDSLINSDSKVESKGLSISYCKTLGNFDIYFENKGNRYNKILREDENEDGYLSYFSLSGDLSGFNLLYEYKDYNMLYYMPVISNPPLVFGETTSVLISRIQHNINFADEIGHQFELRNNINDISLLMNISIGMKHSGIRNPNAFYFDDEFNLVYETYDDVSFSDIFSFTDMARLLLYGDSPKMNFLDEDLRAHKPFRDIYFEVNGWKMNNSFYYKFGYLSHYSYDNASGKNYQSYTVPTQFVVGLKNQNSLTIYYEYQETKNLVANFDNSDYDEDVYKYNYMSLSYHINDFGSISYFSDRENIQYYIDGSDKTRYWTGFELSLELSSTMQLSIFKGSQKGGLVCANGVCAVQPSFEDGIKVTFRALF